MKSNFDTIIVGAGVAGMTAALYLKRGSVDCCILEKELPGGQINRTSTIENYPGLKEITGPELAQNMLEQIQSLGVDYRYGDVQQLIHHGNMIEVKTASDTFTCKSVILATGRSPKKLGIENEDKLTGRGISWCAICDGPLYKGKKAVIIGGGSSALEEALYLSGICSEVTIINRSDRLKAPLHFQEKIKEHDNIKVLYNTFPKKFIEEDNKLAGVRIENPKAQEVRDLPCDACFIYIGQKPNTEWLKDLSILDNEGYILTNSHLETRLPNVFAVGDAIKKNLYQIVTATADGARAAMQIIERK